MPDIKQIESELGINHRAAIVEPVQHPVLVEHEIQLYMKREDLLHPVISGNKWRKLKYNLLHAITTGHQHIISMGGAYSNHLHALAYIGHKLSLKTTGLIRGEQPAKENQTLRDLRQWGMHLEFVNRETFRELRKYHDYDSEPAKRYKGYWITEGGANQHALAGIAEMLNEIDMEYDTLALACGTGTTLAGLAKELSNNKQVLGFSALKGENFLEDDVCKLLQTNNSKHKKNWSINFDYHFGGFAKSNNKLISFIDEIQDYNNIPLEPVYNGKMLFGLFDLIKREYFKKGQKIIAIHTGGLQGNRK